MAVPKKVEKKTEKKELNAKSKSLVIPKKVEKKTEKKELKLNAKSNTLTLLPPKPTIEWKHSAAQLEQLQHVTKNTYPLEAWVSSKAALKKVQLYVNELPQGKFSVYKEKTKKLVYTARLQEGENTIKVLATNAGGRAVSSILTVHYQPAKPLITWTNGTAPAESEQVNYKIQACIHSDMALEAVKIYVNDVLQTQQRGFKTQEKVSCDEKIERDVLLRAGSNSIKIVAASSAGTSTSEVLSVSYIPPVETRLALIIGNAKYANGGTLANPVHDAQAMSQALEHLGFEVMQHTDADYRSMHRAIDEFGTKLKDYDIGLFFYAGHGIQVEGKNYLIPSTANIESKNDVIYECVDAGKLLGKMEDAQTKANCHTRRLPK